MQQVKTTAQANRSAVAAAVAVAIGSIVLYQNWPRCRQLYKNALRTFHHGAGREQRLLEHVLKTAAPNDPTAVVAAIDDFAYNNTWLMNVGDVKGELVDKVLLDHKPKVCLELGAYCGYSATRFASLLQPGAKLITIEKSEPNARVAKRVLSHAGLLDTKLELPGSKPSAGGKVELIVGILETSIEALQARGVTFFDFVFLDHWKDQYLPDLKRLLAGGFLRKGSVVVADNVGWPGVPDYRKYMQESKEFETVEHETTVEYSDRPDLVLVSVYKGPATA